MTTPTRGKNKAALHNPDQIAGGNPTEISGLGDINVNSSIGSQWQYRIVELEELIRKASENMTEAQKKSTFLNIELIFNN